MSEQIVKVARIGKRADSEDPNDFIFHSRYNTFKIIVEGTKVVTVAASTDNQSFTQAHGLGFIPTMTAFAIETGQNRVFLPNSEDVSFWGVKAGWIVTGIKFNYIAADATNLTFNFDSDKVADAEVSIRYYVLEGI